MELHFATYVNLCIGLGHCSQALDLVTPVRSMSEQISKVISEDFNSPTVSTLFTPHQLETIFIFFVCKNLDHGRSGLFVLSLTPRDIPKNNIRAKSH